MSPQFNRLPVGSLILVTGGTGLIGSAVVALLLSRGFKCRIATRSVARQQLFKLALETKYGRDNVELVEVDDYEKEESWDRMLTGKLGITSWLIAGVQGVQHLASDVSFGTDYEVIVEGAKTMVTSFLKTASKHDSVRSVVLTSSRIAAYDPTDGKDIHATKEDWTEYFFDIAKNTSMDDPIKPMAIYAASKVAEEQTAWKFVKETNPSFAFSTVLPDYVSGPIANPTPGSYSTNTWLNEIFFGKIDGLGASVMKPASRLVDVRDVAAIHVAAMLDETAAGRRLFAAPHKFTLNAILAVWREALPGRSIRDDVDFGHQPDVNVEDQESTQLLWDFFGRGWISLKESVVANTHNIL